MSPHKLDGIIRRCHTFSADNWEFVDENLRHEFSEHETSFTIKLSNGVDLRAIWPTKDDIDDNSNIGLFYLKAQRHNLSSVAAIKRFVGELGVVPVLSPIEHRENVLERSYFWAQRDTRRATRHFRNHLLRLRSEGGDELETFFSFVREWTPEVQSLELVNRGGEINLFYKEPESRTEREISWAGDGLQVWLQILLHVHLLSAASSIVLDEPDVYLHADLQRRLVRLLETLPAQCIIATHSTEIAAESNSRDIVWIDKSRRQGIRNPGQEIFAAVSSSLGSRFNLAIARALRAEVALFVEGDDMRLVRRFAHLSNATRLSTEMGFAVIPLGGGASRVPSVEPFSWLRNQLLEGSVKSFVILDRDYRPDSVISAMNDKFSKAGVEMHVWSRKEIENYILVTSTIARCSGAGESQIITWLEHAAEEVKEEVYAQMLFERQRADTTAKRHPTSITVATRKEFEKRWVNFDYRMRVCPPKELLARLNERLQRARFKTVSGEALARFMIPAELDMEVRSLMVRLENLITRG
jgi:hypothetical protein